ncbi:MAG: hypothetical protein KAY24_00845 [Candidatus Eisenbacteria sp.]|nr:hypothetical protein [Candidatus Eisenbacteria bacterium]
MMDTKKKLICAARLVVLPVLLILWPLEVAADSALKAWWDTFEDNNLNCWTINQVGASIGIDSNMANNGIRSLRVVGASGAGQYARAYSRNIWIDFTRDYTVQFAFRYDSFHWDRFLIFGHIRLVLDYPSLPVLYDPVGDNSFVGNAVSGNSFESYLPDLEWGWITVHCRPSLQQYEVFVNGTHMGTVNYQATVIPSQQFWFEDNGSPTNYLNAWYDDCTIRGYVNPQNCNYSIASHWEDAENNCAMWAHPPNVPYHGQYSRPGHPLHEPCCPPGPNGRCMVACLQMVFDRFGDNLPGAGPGVGTGPQEEIEAAANTNDRVNCPNGVWTGTYQDDLRRAGHFSSSTNQAALTALRNQCPPPQCPPAGQGASGYSWRDLGYAVVDSIWTDLAPADADSMDAGAAPVVLEALIGSGYPIIALINPSQGYCQEIEAAGSEGTVDCDSIPENTDSGHACVIIGYDNVGNQGPPQLRNPHAYPAFLIHDPAVCRFGWIGQQYFWNQVWTSKRFAFAAPWELKWLSPPRWCYGQKYNGTLLVKYPGPEPLDGFYSVANAKAKLTLTNVGLQGGEVRTHNLVNISTTGDWQFSTWKLANGNFVQGGNLIGTVDYLAYGTLAPAVSSTSYVGYTDDLGGTGSATKGLTLCFFVDLDIGHTGWPYAGHWWSGAGGSSIKLVGLGGPTHELCATVGNFGEEPTPPGTFLHFWFEDPGAAQRAPGEYPIAALEVPSLAFGDTVTLGPVPWTAPPGNVFGEPHFTIFTAIDCPGDPPESDWPQDENNFATLSEFHCETTPGEPVGMSFWVENPEPTAMEVILQVDKPEGVEAWDVALSLPVGEPIFLSPLEMIPTEVTVTPTTGPTEGSISVECFLYIPGGELVRETGGITLTLHLPTSSAPDDGMSRPVFALGQNQPNPFAGPATIIRFATPRAGHVDLRVYDVGGRMVRTLISERRSSGWHATSWPGTDERGRRVANGVYFYQLDLDGGVQRTRTMLILR